MRPFCSLFLLVGLAVLSSAQIKPVSLPVPKHVSASESRDSSAARLPVKRVVLYKNGIGYFEHTARVHGTQDLNIDFTTGQLNDVLKSLTVVDLGEGQIASGYTRFARCWIRKASSTISGARLARVSTKSTPLAKTRPVCGRT